MTEINREPNSTERKSSGKLDALVVLGKNIGVDWTKRTVRDQRFHLSPHSRISVLGAGIMYKLGLTERIIFSTGKTAGKDLPSEAQAMRDQLKRIFPSIPDKAIILEEHSKNTDTNAEEVKKIIDKYPFILQNVGLMTVGFHLPRASMLFGLHGLHLDEYASDEVLGGNRPSFARFIENYLQSPLVGEEVKKEATALKIQSNALGRLVLRSMTRITRA